MRLDNDAGGRCQLLYAVHHRFVGALPDISPSSSLEELNVITVLRDSINRIPFVFNSKYAGYDLSSKAFQSGLEALDNVLWLFESLVHDTAPEIVDLGQQDEIKTKFRRLVALQQRITHPENFPIATSQFDAISISFGTDLAHYRVANFNAHSFNQTMTSIFSEVDRQSNGRICEPIQQGVEIDMSSLYQAQRLAEASERLSKLLGNTICHTDPDGHKAHIRLSGFEKPEFEIIVSLCQGTDLWQQVYFYEQCDPCTQTQAGIREICAELQRSHRRKKVPRMFFDQERICNDSNTQSSVVASAKPSKRTIRQILRDEGQLRRQKGLQHRAIKKNEKERLGLRIATSLLNLYGSPFLQNVLNADTIYILPENFDDANRGAVVEAYISCTLSSESTDTPSLIEDPVPGDPYILALTTVLLELELEEEVVVLETDIDDSSDSTLPSLYMALTRLLDVSEGDMDIPYYQIIDSCLTLYDQFSDLEGKEYIRKVRTELFTKVVYQLRKRYDVRTNPPQTARLNAPITQETADESNLGLVTQICPIRTSYEPLKTISEVSEVSIMSESPIPPPSLPLPFTSDPLLLASTESISSSKLWLDKIDRINNYLKTVLLRQPKARRVRIAILDTGCDLDAPCLVNMGNSDVRLRNNWQDWSGTSKKHVDEDPNKHGTTLAALLLRVAPHADVFIGRVAKNANELAKADAKIAEAISYVATQWDADIVTMSFGFPDVIKSIKDAIDVAIKEKEKGGKGILFFAAANNDGANADELFPASCGYVVSVRGTDHTGAFVKKYNPDPWPQDKDTLYGTLGHEVPYDFGEPENPAFTTSGCSVATPILAGIMAMIVQYVNWAASADTRISARLQTKEGALRVLHYIADGNDKERYRYVAPWKFFKRDEEDRLALIRHAIAELQKQK